MELLEQELNIGGYRLREIGRDGDVAVYEQRDLDPEKKSVAYEVIIIQRRPAQMLFGRSYPAREVYPAPERWGEQGWTLTNREAALKKANEVSVAQLSQTGRARIPFRRQGALQGRKATVTA